MIKSFNMKSLKKGVFGVACALCIITSMSSSVFAATKQTKTMNTSEFGVLMGEVSYIGIAHGQKNINFWVKTGKIAPKLLTHVDVVDATTGVKLDGDGIWGLNTRSVGYTCECHSDKANTRTVSAFGSHEARGKTGAVVYTKITNLK